MKTLPVHLDVFAFVILLGVAQGVFLGVFFLTGLRGKRVANRCIGWLMLGLSAIIGEIFLNYSNYTFRLLWLVDFAEPFNFLMGPLFYLFVFSRVRHRLPRLWSWHLLPFGIWLVNAATWLYQPVEFKYNSYVGSLHPEIPCVPAQRYWAEDFTGVRDFINELTLFSCLVYSVLSLLVIRQAYRRGGYSFWRSGPALLGQLRNLTFSFSLLPLLIVFVKLQFQEDLGDYLLACYLTGVIYATSLLVMRGSSFFGDETHAPVMEPPTPAAESLSEPKKKYEKSSLSGEVEGAVLTRLTDLLTTEKPYLQPDISLPKLARQLNTNPHHLSQLLNDRLGQNFFDWLATHRIAEAQRLLSDSATVNLKIDEIAERVGYNSPSAFHTAFKRLTNVTPAQFRASRLDGPVRQPQG